MAAKIGILGESTATTRGSTVTLYTVPASKAARVKLLFMLEGPAATDSAKMLIRVGAPGTENTIRINASGVNIDVWTGHQANTTPDPANAVNSENGMMDLSGGLDNMDDDSANLDYIVAPLKGDYFLSTGDTVTRRITGGADPVDALVQVVGVEDDA